MTLWNYLRWFPRDFLRLNSARYHCLPDVSINCACNLKMPKSWCQWGQQRLTYYSSQYTVTHDFFAALRVMFLMPRVCFKPITWYVEMHHARTFFSVWRHGFFVLRDVHSRRVYLQEESLLSCLSCRTHLKNRSEFVLIIFYLQLINSGHAGNSMADKKRGKFSSWR